MKEFLLGIWGAIGLMAVIFAVFYFAIFMVYCIVYFGGHLMI